MQMEIRQNEPRQSRIGQNAEDWPYVYESPRTR